MTTARACHGEERAIREAMKAQGCCMTTEPTYHLTLDLRGTILWIQVTEGKTEDLWELSLPAKAEAGEMQSWTSDPLYSLAREASI